MKHIKSLILLLSISVGLILTESCKEEMSCDAQSCQNGGECIDGTCDCPDGYRGTNCEDFDPCAVQQLLDDGQSPQTLFDGGITLEQLYGKTYECGLIFYLNTADGTGKVAAFSDASTTLDFIEAITYCEDLNLEEKTDWFLPSDEDLNWMWTNLADADGDNINTGIDDPNNLGGFIADDYWSASEGLGLGAYIQSFSDGTLDLMGYSALLRVRAVRGF